MTHIVTRRTALAQLGLVALGAALPHRAGASVGPAMAVYKSPSCGCCTAWVKHMRGAGFVVTTHDTNDVDAVKTQLGIRRQFASCHTGVVGRFVVEGHVPADLVLKLVKEQPDALGLAVPGMPAGSPGMEGGTPDRYQVLLLARDGTSRVYAQR